MNCYAHYAISKGLLAGPECPVGRESEVRFGLIGG
jgi:hypothetical protein